MTRGRKNGGLKTEQQLRLEDIVLAISAEEEHGKLDIVMLTQGFGHVTVGRRPPISQLCAGSEEHKKHPCQLILSFCSKVVEDDML